MTWSKFDDGYDEHEKVDAAWDREPAAVGLHVMATTACNRWESDGVTRPKWLLGKLPSKKQRERVLDCMVDVGLFDLLPAGEIREVRDSDGNWITLGPFSEDRYVVHDFLDRHESSVQLRARRDADAARKRSSRESPANVRPDSERTPLGVLEESAGSPRVGADGHADAQAFPPPPPPPPPKKQEAPLLLLSSRHGSTTPETD